MPPSRKYHKSSLYYPDDKDLYDFMHASKASATKLRTFLKRRGIYLSTSVAAATYYSYISRLPLAWDDLVELVDLIDLADQKESSGFIDYNFAGPMDLVGEAFSKVDEARASKKKESYKITQRDDRVFVEVNYIDIDTSKTPMLQGRPATLHIEVERVEGGLRATHTCNDVAAKILLAFQGALEESYLDKDGNMIPIETNIISLKDILDAKLRIKYFTLLTQNLEGLTYDNTTNVKVAKMPKEVSAQIGSEDEEDELDTEEEQKIKNIIIQGVDIATTPQYESLLKDGFFISSITWEAIDNSTKDRVAFAAGFVRPDEATGLEFKMLHRQKFENGEYQSKEKVLPMVQTKYRALIQKSAIASLNAVRTIVGENVTEPAQLDNE